jgi:hypothetical protein
MPYLTMPRLGALDVDLLNRELRNDEWGATVSSIATWTDSPDLGSLKRKLKKAVRKVTAPIKKIHKKITPKFMQQIEQKAQGVHKKVYEKGKKIHERTIRPILMKYVVPVAGGILGPFTFGLTTLAAAALTAGYKIHETKQLMKKAVKGQERAIAAEEAKYNSEFDSQSDALYSSAQATHFVPLGYTPDVWARMSRDEKSALITQLQAGTAKPYGGGTVRAPSSAPSIPAATSFRSGGGGGAAPERKEPDEGEALHVGAPTAGAEKVAGGFPPWLLLLLLL